MPVIMAKPRKPVQPPPSPDGLSIADYLHLLHEPVVHGIGAKPPPIGAVCQPTDVPPGPNKVEILALRAENDQPLWDPEHDAPLDFWYLWLEAIKKELEATDE